MLRTGYTESSMTAPLFQDPELRGKLLEAHPFRGLGVPDDLARACVFLASEDAAWVSGVSSWDASRAGCVVLTGR